MGTQATLDKVEAAIAKLAANVKKSIVGAAKTTEMTLEQFVGHALGEIKKLGGDKPEAAKQRVDMLQKNVASARAQLAKAGDGADAASMTIDVQTAWTPSGDPAMPDLTTGADQSSTEIAPGSISAATGNTNFATNLDEVAKALTTLQRGLGKAAADDEDDDDEDDAEKRQAAKAKGDDDEEDDDDGEDDAEKRQATKPKPGAKPTTDDEKAKEKRGAAKKADAGDAAWPLDLNTKDFREGVAKADAEPTWGYDPDEIAQPKAK